MTKHKKGEIVYEKTWDGSELTLNGVRLNCEVGAKRVQPIEDIPFADLAHKVNIHPSYTRGDGFMLTRCVQYAATNPEKGYIFPRDFAFLMQKLDDGRQLHPRHLDAASMSRWKRKTTWMVGELPEVETFHDVDDSDDELEESPMNLDEGDEDMGDINDLTTFQNNLIDDREAATPSEIDLFNAEYHYNDTPVDQIIAMEEPYASGVGDIDPFSLWNEQFDLWQQSILLDQFGAGSFPEPQEPLLPLSRNGRPLLRDVNPFSLSHGHFGNLDIWQQTIPLDHPSTPAFLQPRDPSFPSTGFGEMPLQRSHISQIPGPMLQLKDFNDFAPYDWRAPSERFPVAHTASDGVAITSPPLRVPTPPQLRRSTQVPHFCLQLPLDSTLTSSSTFELFLLCTRLS
jgi:hypothetical protein